MRLKCFRVLACAFLKSFFAVNSFFNAMTMTMRSCDTPCSCSCSCSCCLFLFLCITSVFFCDDDDDDDDFEFRDKSQKRENSSLCVFEFSTLERRERRECTQNEKLSFFRKSNESVFSSEKEKEFSSEREKSFLKKSASSCEETPEEEEIFHPKRERARALFFTHQTVFCPQKCAKKRARASDDYDTKHHSS